MVQNTAFLALLTVFLLVGWFACNRSTSSICRDNLDRITVVIGLLWFACIVTLGLVMKYHK